jgi:hypothetical protein
MLWEVRKLVTKAYASGNFGPWLSTFCSSKLSSPMSNYCQKGTAPYNCQSVATKWPSLQGKSATDTASGSLDSLPFDELK